MGKKAPRLPFRAWRALARGAFLALSCWLPGAAASEIVGARYSDPTARYPHGVLGDRYEYETLEVTLDTGRVVRVHWPDQVVFEDTSPRLADMDGDGRAEVVVVESHEAQGARVAIYAERDGDLVAMAQTPYIGTRFRWLAIAGLGDLDGDGLIEFAYVDRPHLAKTLRVWRVTPLDAGTTYIEQVASLPGVTNHRIGEVDIAGGLRSCEGQPIEMVLATADWRRLVAVRFDGANLNTRDLGPHRDRGSFAAAMQC